MCAAAGDTCITYKQSSAMNINAEQLLQAHTHTQISISFAGQMRIYDKLYMKADTEALHSFTFFSFSLLFLSFFTFFSCVYFFVLQLGGILFEGVSVKRLGFTRCNELSYTKTTL